MSKTSGPVFQLINNFRFDSYYPRENIELVINYKPENTNIFSNLS